MQFLKNYRRHPIVVLLAAYQLFMLALNILFSTKIDHNLEWIGFDLLVLIFLGLSKINRIDRLVTWSPLIIIPVNFSQLHFLVHTVHPVDFDLQLIQIDHFLFGIHPTVWLEQFTLPIITEILQIIYSTFYFLPIFLGLILFFKHERENFEFFIFQIVFGFYLSYAGYFSIPAIGPRFTIDHLQKFSLNGVWMMEEINMILNKLENIQRDAFPSGHTALTLLTLFYAKKFSRKYYFFMIPVTTLMIISTVYLRYHYVIDVIAGVLLFIVLITLGPFIYKKLQK